MDIHGRVPPQGPSPGEGIPSDPPRVPPRALVLSLGALAAPLLASVLAPEWFGDEYALLIWLPALIPAFLLTYYRGWGGASAALAAAMATLVISQVLLAYGRARPPEWQFLLILVPLWVAVCLGVGWFGELLHRARREAEALALRDPLTGLPNRGHLNLFLSFAFGSAQRGGCRMVAVLFDLDDFKTVNDRHGHAAGDETLVAFARILAANTRRSDLSARFGGEEFVAVLTGPGAVPGAAIFAERIRKALSETPLPWGPVTVSVGIAEYTSESASPEAVLEDADRALYEAKRQGKDRVVTLAPSPKAPAGGVAARVD